MAGGADGKRTIAFTADGRTIEAREGQSVGAALWAHGDRVLSRSTKYHRPRGWACGTGDCGNCLMRIDDLPNRRACMEPVRDGMNVEGQNAWPSVRRDVWRVNDIVFRRGFDHHHGFVRPRILYPLFGQVIRAFAGWGRIPDHVPPRPRAEARRVDVAVVGAGPAGLAAAAAAANAGAGVVLIEEQRETGGVAAWLTRSVPDPDSGGAEDVPWPRLVARWRDEVARAGRVETMTETAVAAAYPGGLIVADGRDVVTVLRADALVVATGGTATTGLFGNNDLPGIMTTTGCLTLLNRDGVKPGRRAIVYGAGAHGLATALELHAAGVPVARVVEPTRQVPGPEPLKREAEQAGIHLAPATRIESAHGWGRVRAATLENGARRERVQTDLVVVALGHKTLPVVFQALGARLTHDPQRGGTVPVVDADQATSVPGLFAAGDAAGITSLAGARASGQKAGRAAARHAQTARDEAEPVHKRHEEALQ